MPLIEGAFGREQGAVAIAIQSRAMQFARTFKFENPRVTRFARAEGPTVERYGTPESTVYGETVIHMDYPPDVFEFMSKAKPEKQAAARDFLVGGTDLLVVCSATDVIYHEFLGIQFS